MSNDIQEQLFNKLSDFRNACQKNRVFPESEFITQLLDNIDKFEISLHKGEIKYRARIYNNSIFNKLKDIMDIANNAKDETDFSRACSLFDEYHENLKNNNNKGFWGYDEKDSFVNNNIDTIRAGRCNHDFERVLYITDSVETAISELKPLIKEKISVAKIELLEDLKIIDFTFALDEKNEIDCLKSIIALLFIQSPTEEDKDAYIYTQILCALVKKLGYDGIKYNSCQNCSATNYVIFNYNKCKAVGSSVYTVKEINYDIERTVPKEE